MLVVIAIAIMMITTRIVNGDYHYYCYFVLLYRCYGCYYCCSYCYVHYPKLDCKTPPRGWGLVRGFGLVFTPRLRRPAAQVTSFSSNPAMPPQMATSHED